MEYSGFISRLQGRSGVRGRGLFQPLRAALTGRLDGPELGAFSLLGTARVWNRLDTAEQHSTC